MATVKEEAHRLVDEQPEDATWDDVFEEVELRLIVERGLADMRAGRTIPAEEIERKYGVQREA